MNNVISNNAMGNINTTENSEIYPEEGVLIVDDSKFSRKILSEILINEGFPIVAEAKNGLEAIEMAKEKKPKYVFLDVQMPVLDGLGALPRILEACPEANVIMCTAMGQQNIIMEAAKAGAKDYVLKPFKSENIISVMNAIMISEYKDGHVIPFNKKRREMERAAAKTGNQIEEDKKEAATKTGNQVEANKEEAAAEVSNQIEENKEEATAVAGNQIEESEEEATAEAGNQIEENKEEVTAVDGSQIEEEREEPAAVDGSQTEKDKKETAAEIGGQISAGREETLIEEGKQTESVQEIDEQEVILPPSTGYLAEFLEADPQIETVQEKNTSYEEAAQEKEAQEEAIQEETIQEEAIGEKAIQEQAVQEEIVPEGAVREEAIQEEAAQTEPAEEAAREEAVRQGVVQAEPAEEEVLEEAAREEVVKEEAIREEAAKEEAVQEEAVPEETVQVEAVQVEITKAETAKEEATRETEVSDEIVREKTVSEEVIQEETIHEKAGMEEAVIEEANREGEAQGAAALEEAEVKSDAVREVKKPSGIPYNYLWENRFEASRWPNKLPEPGRQRVSAHSILHPAGSSDMDDALNNQLMVGLAAAYLGFSNRLQIEYPYSDNAGSGQPHTVRILTGNILPLRCKSTVTMSELLRLTGRKGSNGAVNLSKAIELLVQGKGSRTLA